MWNKTTIFKDLIEKHRSQQYFAHRTNKLTLLRSYHIFPIEKYRLAQHPMIVYRAQQKAQSLHQLIEGKRVITTSAIKSIVWQVTKFMINCEEKSINHLRLYPRSVVFAEKYTEQQPFFIYIKDFALGKEFQTVKQGKVLQFFECLHPDLSILNNFFDFNAYSPEFDIWSLGIILYKLVYFQSPFCKQGKNIFSKTILREYLAGKYQIPYTKNEYSSINKLISKCLDLKNEQGLRFVNWKEIKEYILTEQQIYNYLDFHDEYFQEMAKIHTKFMIFMSQMYCMIIDQCRDSPNPFWKRFISQENTTPFQILICQFTLSLMAMTQARFYRIYSGHLFLLKPSTRANLKNISDRVQDQLKFMEDKWIYPKFKSKTITLDVIHLIQDICVRFNLQASQQNVNVEMTKRYSEESDFDSNRITEMRSSVVRRKDSRNSKNSPPRKSMVWRSVQILFDYCKQMVKLISLTSRKEKFKFIFEQLYINTAFSDILINEFHYNQDLSEVFKKVYKEYLEP